MASVTGPRTIGRYRILDLLGAGGMGRVYLAEDPVLGRRLALKLLPDDFRDDPDRRERLLHEARAASALNHPNIVVVHDLGESDGAMYVAMEHVEGVTLAAWAHAARRTPAEALGLARQAARALVAAHAAGLVHRDLKPDNLMVRGDGVLKVLDFGLARSAVRTDVSDTVTAPGTVVGTVPYMAPEQVLGQPATPASDLFSLGVIVYELLTGTHPFAAGSWVDTMHRILHEEPAPPTRLAAGLGGEFDFVLAKALAKDPERRYRAAADLETDLAQLEARCRPAAAGAAARAPGPRTVAVLPFKNIGGRAELGYLSMGLADAVITALASSRDLIVRTTSAVAAYENRPADLRRAGEELAADAVLDASFQLAGERLRATGRLVEVATGAILWAGKVDVRSEDVFELQDRVAQEIAGALAGGRADAKSPPAGAAEPPPVMPARPAYLPGAEAYEHFLRGMDAYRRFDREANYESIVHFEAAVRLAPGFARAWAMLGEARGWVASMGWDPDPVWFARAEEALARARALDPDEGFVHYLSAALHLDHGRKREAYGDLTRARAAMPHFAHVHHYFAYLFRLCGLLDRALEAEQRCWQIEPNDVMAYSGMIHLLALAGDFEEAGRWAERGRLRFGSPPGLERAEMSMLYLAGDLGEIVSRYGAADGHPHPLGTAALALACLRLGETERARRIHEKALPYSAFDMDSAAWAAAFHAWAGESDRAFQHLARATALGLESLPFYEHPQLFEPLWADPRWGPFIDGVRARAAVWERELAWPPAG